ncbi:hypothetical protein ACHAWF_018478 [Thalassiosira exigua]
MMRALSVAVATWLSLLSTAMVRSLSNPKRQFSRRESFGPLVVAPFAVPSISNAIATPDDPQGISAVTDSQIGRAFRRSVVRGAQVADKLDERWERFSDSLRDESKCDKNTGRRLYDNGKRKDGTPIGNPGLGELCAPEPLLPLDLRVKDQILDAAVKSAVVASGEKGGAKADALQKAIEDTKELVRPSFERSMQNSSSEDEKNRGVLKFELYSTLRAITNFLKGDRGAMRAFKLEWGNALTSIYSASSSASGDYVSPFPDKEDEFEDFDYDKKALLDALGKLTVTLDSLKAGGILGFYEISIPYDDYGSVVTVALDDYAPIGAEILLGEQNYLSEGPVQALVRSLFDRARISCSLDTFYIDPSTTNGDNYNPTQLLLSLNSLRKM